MILLQKLSITEGGTVIRTMSLHHFNDNLESLGLNLMMPMYSKATEVYVLRPSQIIQ
jgi:hypothetical protein